MAEFKVEEKIQAHHKILKLILCTVLFWLVIPLALPLLILLYLYRGCVILLQKLLHPNWIGIMSPRDVIVWEEMTKPHLYSVMCSILSLQGQADFDLNLDLAKFQNHFLERVISYQNPQGEFSYAKFQHYFDNWMGFPFWRKEEPFDIKQHIRLLTPDETENGDSGKAQSEIMTEEQLLKIAGHLTTRPLRSRASPWEILVVPKYQPKNCQDPKVNKMFAVVLLCHHTLCDGYSFHKLFQERMCGETTTATRANVKQSVPSRPVPRGIFGTLQRFTEILLNLGMYHAQFFFLDRDVNVWHNSGNENGQSSTKLTGAVHTAKADGVPFSVTRSVSKKLGVAPTATMFSCVAGGIRRYFEMKQLEIPQQMTGFFPWPVDNHPNEGLVNHWSFVDIVLPVGENGPVKRIKRTNVNFQDLKNSPLPQVVWNLSPLFALVPTPLFNVLGWNRKSTLTLTNFPGLNFDSGKESLVVFDKWKLVGQIQILNRLRGNSAVQLALTTDRGNVDVTIAADRGVLTQEGAQQLAQCINQEFKDLECLLR